MNQTSALCTGGLIFRNLSLLAADGDFDSDDMLTLDSPALIVNGSMVGQKLFRGDMLNFPMPNLSTRP